MGDGRHFLWVMSAGEALAVVDAIVGIAIVSTSASESEDEPDKGS